jgi:hypothetical protein
VGLACVRNPPKIEWQPISTDHRAPTPSGARAEQIRRLLPTASVRRTRDTFELTGDEDEGLVIIVTAEAVEVRLRVTERHSGSVRPGALEPPVVA